jgi:hypothetical protein
MSTSRTFGLAVAISLIAASAARAELSEAEQKLQSFLQKEYGAGFFTIGNRGQDASGAFKWGATFHRELRKPLEKLTAHCLANSGVMQLALSAGRLQNEISAVTLKIAGTEQQVSHEELWDWESRKGFSITAQKYGFDGVIPSALIAGRTKTIAAADANPPMGLFVCSASESKGNWAVSIMPNDYAGTGWFYMTIRPVTVDFLDAWRARQLAIIEAAETEEAQRRAEQERLVPFQKSLTVGTQTNCGLVIDDRGPIVEVQLPAGSVGPNGERQFWIKREELADYPAPKGCSYGRQ